MKDVEQDAYSEIKGIAAKFSKESIVTQALTRLITQLVCEVVDSHIKPRDKRIRELEEIIRGMR